MCHFESANINILILYEIKITDLYMRLIFLQNWNRLIISHLDYIYILNFFIRDIEWSYIALQIIFFQINLFKEL